MCTVIDFDTRRRRDTEMPSLYDFLVARFGSRFKVSDEYDPTSAGDIVAIRTFWKTVEDYQDKFGQVA